MATHGLLKLVLEVGAEADLQKPLISYLNKRFRRYKDTVEQAFHASKARGKPSNLKSSDAPNMQEGGDTMDAVNS